MKIIVQDDAAPSDTHVVAEGLIEHALASGVAPRNYEPLVIFLYDEADAIAGGLVGATVWGWLHVQECWIAAPCRGQGWGKRLLEAAEHEAVGRQCHHAYLDTFDFQALGFYQRLGYDVFGSLADFPLGHTRYFVKKSLHGVGSTV